MNLLVIVSQCARTALGLRKPVFPPLATFASQPEMSMANQSLSYSQKFGAFFMNIWNSITHAVRAVLVAIRSFGTHLYQWVAAGLAYCYQAISGVLTPIAQRIAQAFSPYYVAVTTRLSQWALAFMAGLRWVVGLVNSAFPGVNPVVVWAGLGLAGLGLGYAAFRAIKQLGFKKTMKVDAGATKQEEAKDANRLEVVPDPLNQRKKSSVTSTPIINSGAIQNSEMTKQLRTPTRNAAGKRPSTAVDQDSQTSPMLQAQAVPAGSPGGFADSNAQAQAVPAANQGAQGAQGGQGGQVVNDAQQALIAVSSDGFADSNAQPSSRGNSDSDRYKVIEETDSEVWTLANLNEEKKETHQSRGHHFTIRSMVTTLMASVLAYIVYRTNRTNNIAKLDTVTGYEGSQPTTSTDVRFGPVDARLLDAGWEIKRLTVSKALEKQWLYSSTQDKAMDGKAFQYGYHGAGKISDSSTVLADAGILAAYQAVNNKEQKLSLDVSGIRKPIGTAVPCFVTEKNSVYCTGGAAVCNTISTFEGNLTATLALCGNNNSYVQIFEGMHDDLIPAGTSFLSCDQTVYPVYPDDKQQSYAPGWDKGLDTDYYTLKQYGQKMCLSTDVGAVNKSRNSSYFNVLMFYSIYATTHAVALATRNPTSYR
jgi:hypothetical protein